MDACQISDTGDFTLTVGGHRQSQGALRLSCRQEKITLVLQSTSTRRLVISNRDALGGAAPQTSESAAKRAKHGRENEGGSIFTLKELDKSQAEQPVLARPGQNSRPWLGSGCTISPGGIVR